MEIQTEEDDRDAFNKDIPMDISMNNSPLAQAQPIQRRRCLCVFIFGSCDHSKAQKDETILNNESYLLIDFHDFTPLVITDLIK